MKIPGGYILKARKIKSSEISQSPPHTREIWDWILRRVNYKPTVFMGTTIERGQCLTTYQEIIDDLSWRVGWRVQRYSKWQCEEAMKQLRNLLMITTQKTTRGMFITVINYDFYQDSSNYEDHNEHHTEHHKITTVTPHHKQEEEEGKKEIYGAEQVPHPSRNGHVPHEEILALWREILPEKPQPKAWSPHRQQLLRARWKENEKRQDLDYWRRFFRYIRQSPFLMGDVQSAGREPFVLTLPWLLKQENFLKVLERKYHHDEEVH